MAAHESRGGKKATAAKRINMRTKELRIIHRHAYKEKPPWDQFLPKLRARYGGRDPCDPAQVDGKEFRFKLEDKMRIEDLETERGRSKGWIRRDGKQYSFRLRTIPATDVTPKEAERAYKRRANKAGAAVKKAKRAERIKTETKAMSTQQQTKTGFSTYAEANAALKAHTAAQAEALFVAIGTGEITIGELMVRLKSHPLWCTYADDKERFYQAIVNRLRTLQGRVVDRYEPRLQGGNTRFIRRSV
jgi:hypothetical protein